ncbi:hypothetical protein San01_63500 [Streptomyces angustmyceticus]|uniref:Uncharacterized protein n=1 Tax=Streptomyces angustmyceticus TaxID=285578 RepID=A0A5J4LPD3_9ACTN|nr:hypothetical protein San01_63500 [Streptomyces angustmyceticus]
MCPNGLADVAGGPGGHRDGTMRDVQLYCRDLSWDGSGRPAFAGAPGACRLPPRPVSAMRRALAAPSQEK